MKITAKEKALILNKRKTFALSDKAYIVPIKKMVDELEAKINNNDINSTYLMLYKMAEKSKDSEIMQMVKQISKLGEQQRVLIYKFINSLQDKIK